MKKTILITIIVILLGITSAYLTDIYRMSNNMEVIFGTWGHKYAPPSKSGDISKIGTLDETEYGEFIATFDAWMTPEEQKRRAEYLQNTGKNTKNEKNK